MILPSTYEMTLLLSIFSMICWGSWANTFKLSGPKWRFELYYFDFAFGLAITAIILALTFGSMGDELTFADNLLIARKRYLAFAVLAGAVFNLANMLLMAAISIAGMSVAFPIGIGLALIIGTVGNYVQQKTGNPLLIFGGVALVLAAVVFDSMAYRRLALATAASVRRTGATKGIVVSIIAGILMGSFYPIVVMAKAPGTDFGLGPYAILFLFGIGVFFSTIIYNLYFINLPIHGEAIEFGAYLRGSFGQHMLGIIGGVIWCLGAAANFVAASASGAAQIGPAASYALGQGATMISALWGLLVWKEFKGAPSTATTFIWLMLVCFLVGLAMVALASVY